MHKMFKEGERESNQLDQMLVIKCTMRMENWPLVLATGESWVTLMKVGGSRKSLNGANSVENRRRRIKAKNIDESFKLGAITACLCVNWNDTVERKNCIAGKGRDNY